MPRSLSLPDELQHPFDVCKQALAQQPNDAKALRLMGFILAQIGQLDEAAEHLTRSMALAPDVPETLIAQAFLHSRLNKYDEALKDLQRAAEISPNLADIQQHIGDTYVAMNKPQEAQAAYLKALDLKPAFPEALNNLGNLYKKAGQLKEAQDCYVRGIAIAPNRPELYNNLGLVLQKTHPDPTAPVACFLKAIELNPTYTDALNNLGNMAREQGRTEEARDTLQKALATDPANAEAHNNMGLVVLYGDCDFALSASWFEKALQLRPLYPEALNNLAVVKRLMGKHEEALAAFRLALDQKPNYTAAMNNIGNVLKDKGRFDEAIATYRAALELQPDDTETRNNLAMALLANGDYAEGWKLYEARWQTKHLEKAARAYPQPRWQGERAEGKTLYIYAEQGFGDTLQFCRYAPMAAERGLKVILEAQPPLLRLLETLPGVDQLVSSAAPQKPYFDLQIPMLSLPAAFGTNLETIPAAVPYLKPDPADCAAWQAKLPQDPSGTCRVGLVWAGSARKTSPDLIATDARRSIKAEMLAPLMDLEGFRFVSLQKDGPAAPADFPILPLVETSRDFADTAALISTLDLVITVDTAVAHVAGAIGKPVWILNRYDSCWRWQRNRETSPWYPTARLFHQGGWGEWDDVLLRVRESLIDFRSNHTGA